MSEKPIYCGSGKKQNDSWLKVTINPEIISKYVETYEGNKFVRLNINIKDAPDKYGKDVSITVDIWKPNKEMSTGEVTGQVTGQVENSSDLPF